MIRPGWQLPLHCGPGPRFPMGYLLSFLKNIIVIISLICIALCQLQRFTPHIISLYLYNDINLTVYKEYIKESSEPKLIAEFQRKDDFLDLCLTQQHVEKTKVVNSIMSNGQTS